MNEFLGNKEEMDFASIFEDFEGSLSEVRSGIVLKGKIIGFNHAEVFVDISYKLDGVIPIIEFEDDETLKNQLKIGQEVEVYVVRVNDVEGTVQLSVRKAQAQKAWEDVEELCNKGTIIHVKVSDVVKGGLIANWRGLRIFIPASQISDQFIKSLDGFNGSPMRVRIIEFNKKNRRLVGSQRVILEEEKKNSAKDIWEGLSPDKVYKGIVKNITNFGAFVDIGGVDGLIHVSDLSWGKVGHPSDILQVGQEVTVMLKIFDKEKRRISFTYLEKGEDPWVKEAEKLTPNQELEVKVVRLVPYGAFVEILPGIEGLIHISEISDRRIERPSQILKEGQQILAKILEINIDQKKISLSMKDLVSFEG
jgi:4-hydroxy-3-methylbut-2-enyl diphosphate reductase